MTLVWASSFSTQVSDPDAQAYIEAVETQDTQPLEVGVAHAINTFVLGCKADGIWDAIKASCILAGARTLSGALVPLVGTAPTNYNFVSGDYNRETGLVGNDINKYLNSNRACSSDGQDNIHASVFASSRDLTTNRYLAGNGPVFGLIGNTTGFRARVNSGIATLGTNTNTSVLIGVSRASAAGYSWIDGSQSGFASVVSTGISTGNYTVFSDNTPINHTNARLSFYSIGESLDLAALDTRVTTLMTDIGAAIP